MLPNETAEKWNKALCEVVYREEEKVVCPFKDCSVGMIVERDAKIRDCECPLCHRLFCGTCRVPWHEGVTCEDYKRLYKYEEIRDEILMEKLASQMKWMKCPKCQLFVEKVSGVDSSSAMLVDRLGLPPMVVAYLTIEMLKNEQRQELV
uniref:RBR-type E3 ubiquitin transferase n=1 Tax=Cucumis melo TaxID=3656 RepID=A0A9I9E614_CUCME